jgi:hypothetical protein
MSDIVQSILSSEAQQPTGQPEATANQGENVNHSAEFLERFNKLASKEAALRKRDQEWRSEREQMAELRSRLERYEKLGKEDPESLLGEFGHNYDKLTERRLAGLESDEGKSIEQLKREFQEFKDSIVREKQEASKRVESEQLTQAMQNARAEIEEICKSDDYELIRTEENYDLVLDTAAEYYQATGKRISFEDAAKHVEAHLEKKLERILAAKKATSRLQPKGDDPSKQQPQPGQESFSLSSSLSGASRPTPTPVSEDDLRTAFWRAMGST